MPKISIIIPTYNRATYLKIAIESILRQGYDDYEIIITDNNSDDDTEEVVNSFSQSMKIRYFKNSNNLGVAENHNMALKHCDGEYIHLFSDDDIMLPDCLKTKAEILDTCPTVGLVHSDIQIIDSQGEVCNSRHWANDVWKHFDSTHKKSSFFEKNEYHIWLYKIHNLICMPSAMIRKTVIDKIGYFSNEYQFIIDWHYWLKLTLFFDVFYINIETVQYRIHSSSISTKSTKILSKEASIMRRNLASEYPNEQLVTNNFGIEFLQASMYYSDYDRIRTIKFFFLKLLGKVK